MSLHSQNAILRRTVKDLHKRIKIAEITILLDNKNALFLLNRRLHKARIRHRELHRSYQQAKKDYDFIRSNFDKTTKQKRCVVCLEIKTIEAFEKDPRCPTGRGTRCRECESQRMTKYKLAAKIIERHSLAGLID